MAKSFLSCSILGILIAVIIGCQKKDSPDPIAELINKGSAAHVDGDTQAAIEYFTNALSLSPQHTGALRGRATCYLGQKEYDKAIEDLSALIQLDPHDALALADRGRAYLETAKPKLAIADFDAALQVQSDNATVLYLRGKSHQQLGDTEKAARDFDQAKKIAPGIVSQMSR